MFLPEIPTDNLYKFFFVGGLVVMIASVIFGTERYSDVLSHVDANLLELKALNYHMKIGNARNKATLYDLKRIRVRDSLEFETRRKQFSQDTAGKYDYQKYLESRSDESEAAISSAMIDAEVVPAIIDSISLMIQFRSNKVDEEYNQVYITLLFFSVFFCAGFGMTLYGYHRWNFYIQKPSDRRTIIDMNRLEYEYQKELNERIY